MDLENGVFQNHVKRESWKTVLTLAYQSLGVVYGDLSTSPLYVYKSTFAEDIQHSETNEEIYGVLSFVFWTLTLVPLLKYVFIVLKADDNGEGGTFALYSLLCRHARINSLPNCQVADEELYEYKRDAATTCLTPTTTFGSRLKSTLEKHKVLQRFLLLLALIGTCMVIGDGVLTPALSVFSAVSGLELSMAKEHHKYVEVPVTCTILIGLFALQHYGTHRVGFLFAPVVLMWLMCISAIGIYNIIHWNPHVYQALSPYYMYKFLRKTQRGGWMSLGGILLCITGSEAMFADLGHFSQLSIKIAFTSLVYPSLILAYMGQAAYLSQHHVIDNDYHIGFYVSVPGTTINSIEHKCAVLFCAQQSNAHFVCSIKRTLCHKKLRFGSYNRHASYNMPDVSGYRLMLAQECLPCNMLWHIGPRQYRLYRCIVRYGYRDVHKDDMEFEKDLVCSIAEYIRTGNAEPNGAKDEMESEDDKMTVVGTCCTHTDGIQLRDDDVDKIESAGTSELREIKSPPVIQPRKRVRFIVPDSSKINRDDREELQELMEAREAGIAYILGHCYVRAKQGSSMLKKLVINYGYEFLRRNSRAPAYTLSAPHASTLEVGMVYSV
ncbi:hypothetical protein SADUNF_Sadunf10G0070200 [Salix dunnii]|uniref:Potassium transporter n=1 Tax=Salix dunnii TaxID=1413687 RepID=A0A835MY62_9ROSI|nr:hypothetical protein SADUNF_Sadunf10G0070200 [Salix dunnii]